jgi:hypothetical protein
MSLFIMETSYPCFEDRVIETVRVISTGGRHSENEMSEVEVHHLSTLDQIQSHFSRTDRNEYPYHFTYVLQELYLHNHLILIQRGSD